MTTLGDILGAAKRSAPRFQAWIEAADPALAEDMRQAADRAGEGPASFARVAVADFSRFADEEDWAELMRIVRDEGNPGTACLTAMVRWRLEARSCERHR